MCACSYVWCVHVFCVCVMLTLICPWLCVQQLLHFCLFQNSCHCVEGVIIIKVILIIKLSLCFDSAKRSTPTPSTHTHSSPLGSKMSFVTRSHKRIIMLLGSIPATGQSLCPPLDSHFTTSHNFSLFWDTCLIQILHKIAFHVPSYYANIFKWINRQKTGHIYSVSWLVDVNVF